jgi:hypothetical protein
MKIIEKQNSEKPVMKTRFTLLLLLTVSFLTASLNLYGQASNISHLKKTCRDASTCKPDLKTAKAKNDSIHYQYRNASVSFGPNDPDDVTPKPVMGDTSGSLRATMAMKVYLDGLTIDPKSTDLLKNAKNVFTRALNESKVDNNELSFNEFQKANLLPLK